MSAVTALAIACGTIFGCQSAEKPSDDPAAIPSGPLIESTTWPFWPDAVRIHPLTRLTDAPDSGQPVIELRLEFTDVYGHTTKCVGLARAELHDGGVDPDAVLPEGRAWTTELNRLGLNRTHYDEVTRTYLLRLVIAPELLPPDPVLRVLFESVDGRILEATRPLPR